MRIVSPSCIYPNRMAKHIMNVWLFFFLFLCWSLSSLPDYCFAPLLVVDSYVNVFFHSISMSCERCRRKLWIDATQSSNGVLDQIPNRPRFVCTVPTGVYLQPSKELPVVKHQNASNDVRTYAYFSIPKVFAQRNNDGPITEIHGIQAVASSLFNKPVSKRYVHNMAVGWLGFDKMLTHIRS